jgi:hypothetical protein
LILGVTGACRYDEITNLAVGDIEDLDPAILVKVQDTKNYKSDNLASVVDFTNNMRSN